MSNDIRKMFLNIHALCISGVTVLLLSKTMNNPLTKNEIKTGFVASSFMYLLENKR